MKETHSNILAWEIPFSEEPGGLQSMGLQKSHNLSTKQQQQNSSYLIFADWETHIAQ